MDLLLPSPLVEVDWKIAGRTHMLSVKRDDLIHPLVSGNKWRKLRLVLEDARKLGKNTLVSFGGAWSNHLLALAVAAEALGFKSVAFVRGDELQADTHGQLARYRLHGMELLPVSGMIIATKLLSSTNTSVPILTPIISTKAGHLPWLSRDVWIYWQKTRKKAGLTSGCRSEPEQL